MDKIIKAGALCLVSALSSNSWATLLVGTFEGTVQGTHFDKTGNITGASYAGLNKMTGRRLTGTFRLDLDRVPLDMNASTVIGDYRSTTNWIDISINGFNEPFYPTSRILTVNDRYFVDATTDVLRLTDERRTAFPYDPLNWKYLDLDASNDLFRTDAISQGFSWTGSGAAGGANFGSLRYDFVWKDATLGVDEKANGTILLTSVNMYIAPTPVSIPLSSSLLLLVAGGIGLSATRRKR